MPRGRPHASWLRQVESYLEDMGMAGLGFALDELKCWYWSNAILYSISHIGSDGTECFGSDIYPKSDIG